MGDVKVGGSKGNWGPVFDVDRRKQYSNACGARCQVGGQVLKHRGYPHNGIVCGDRGLQKGVGCKVVSKDGWIDGGRRGTRKHDPNACSARCQRCPVLWGLGQERRLERCVGGRDGWRGWMGGGREGGRDTRTLCLRGSARWVVSQGGRRERGLTACWERKEGVDMQACHSQHWMSHLKFPPPPPVSQVRLIVLRVARRRESAPSGNPHKNTGVYGP